MPRIGEGLNSDYLREMLGIFEQEYSEDVEDVAVLRGARSIITNAPLDREAAYRLFDGIGIDGPAATAVYRLLDERG